MRALILPHGSLRQAGAVTGRAVGGAQLPRRCILLGPSHAGSALRWSVMSRGAYRTPLGDVPIDESLSGAVLECCPFLEADAWNQPGEHTIEVLLPFLQFVRPGELSIISIITSSDTEEEFVELAQALAQLIRVQTEEVLLIASSDLSHYEEASIGAQKDRQLIETILRLDGLAVVRQIHGGLATMCGYGPVACVLMAARQLGATEGRLLGYATSTETGGDPNSAIGYGGILIR